MHRTITMRRFVTAGADLTGALALSVLFVAASGAVSSAGAHTTTTTMFEKP
jgi:hypothetical protein